MIGKVALILGASSLAFVPQPAATRKTSTVYPDVRQVSCDGSLGTAFRIRDGRLISADHVTNGANCKVDGDLLQSFPEEPLDFSTSKPIGLGVGFKINCDGMKPGTYVFAVGYAYGYPWQTMTRHLVTTLRSPSGLRALLGYPTVIPGMSGGPVLGEDGRVVGIVNSYSPFGPFSGSRDISETSLCK